MPRFPLFHLLLILFFSASSLSATVTHYLSFDHVGSDDLSVSSEEGLSLTAGGASVIGFSGAYGSDVSEGAITGVPFDSAQLTAHANMDPLPDAWNQSFLTRPGDGLAYFQGNDGGRRVTFGLADPLAVDVAQTYYFSALFRPGDDTDEDTFTNMDTFRFRFVDGNRSGQGLEFGIGGGNWLGDGDDNPVAVTTYMLVGRFEIAANGSASTSYSVFSGSDDLPRSEPESFDFSNSGTYNNPIVAVDIFNRTTQGSYFDEFRVGTDWADVAPIPEPATITALVGLISFGLVFLRRRRG